jgi:tetratricopeptide (TPR) repeat protein
MSGNLLSGETVDQTELEVRQSQQLEFFLTVLQSIHDSNSDPTVVHLLLKENLDFLDDGIIDVATNWLCSKLASTDQDLQDFILIHILYFSGFLLEFPLGDKAIKIELSITLLIKVLKEFANTEHHMILATAQQNIGLAYSERIHGDRAENLEESIKHYLSALEIFNRFDLLSQLMATQNNLAYIYSIRIRGERSSNQEESIELYLSTLEFLNKQDFPLQWAAIQNNLANIYSKRVIGNPKENSEESLKYYRAALEIFTPESFSSQWANIQIQLARFSISQLGNYRLASEHLRAAYEKLSINNDYIDLLAQTMFELARCFHQTGALGQAKIHFKDSIRLYQKLKKPLQVAAASSALGNLELQMGYLDDARIHLQTALDFYQNTGNIDRIKSIQELQQYLPEFIGEKVA